MSSHIPTEPNFEPCYCAKCDGKLPAPCRYGTGSRTSNHRVLEAFDRLFAGKQLVREAHPQTLGCERYRLTVSGQTLGEFRDLLERALTPETTPQAPIANIIVDDNGEVSAACMYAPGLPVGSHDVYCEPPAPGGQKVPHPCFESAAPETSQTVSAEDVRRVVEWCANHVNAAMRDWDRQSHVLLAAADQLERVPVDVKADATGKECPVCRRPIDDDEVRGSCMHTKDGKHRRVLPDPRPGEPK